MWIPHTFQEIDDAIAAGQLVESATFDAKREYDGKTLEIAKDIAAMSIDGGVIIFGIDEDQHKRLTIPSAVPLKGLADSINQIATTCIAEVPVIRTFAYEDPSDPSVGYLVVFVAPSPRAPHMVIKSQHNRFYCRRDTISVPMSEGDVARLYERRSQTRLDLDKWLRAELANEPLPRDKRNVRMHLLARPVFPDDTLLARAAGDLSVRDYLTRVVNDVRDVRFGLQSSLLGYPDNWHIMPGDRYCSYLYGEDTGTDPRLDIEFSGSGGIHLYHSKIASLENPGDPKYMYGSNVARFCMWFIMMAARIYQDANYYANVDLGCGFSGLHGAKLYAIRRQDPAPYPEAIYLKSATVPALGLNDAIRPAAESLLKSLFRVMSNDLNDPFVEVFERA